MDPLKLLALSVSLGIPLGGDYPTTLDISPTFGLEVNSLPRNAGAMTLPGVVLHQPGVLDSPHILREELNHVTQQQALGPLFWGAYGATGGRAFEPYDPLGGWGEGYKEEDVRNMWMPPREMEGNFPLFRVRGGGGEDTSLEVLPGYGEAFELLGSLLGLK